MWSGNSHALILSSLIVINTSTGKTVDNLSSDFKTRKSTSIDPMDPQSAQPLADAYGLLMHRNGQWEWTLAPAAGVWLDRNGLVASSRPSKGNTDLDPSLELMRRCRHASASVGVRIYIYGGLRAAYCTGLLLARRVLKKLEIDAEYEGNFEASGEDFSVEPAESRRPFRALLDVGLLRTTTGNRVFGALKGALDGGLDIPHSEKRFAGFSKDGKQLDADVHRKYIFGGHVASYMKALMEDEPEKYQTHFSEYVKKEIDPDDIEAMYKKVHAAIRADPTVKKSEKQPPKEHKRYNLKKLTYEERKNKLIERLNALNSAVAADDEDEDDE